MPHQISGIVRGLIALNPNPFLKRSSTSRSEKLIASCKTEQRTGSNWNILLSLRVYSTSLWRLQQANFFGTFESWGSNIVFVTHTAGIQCFNSLESNQENLILSLVPFLSQQGESRIAPTKAAASWGNTLLKRRSRKTLRLRQIAWSVNKSVLE